MLGRRDVVKLFGGAAAMPFLQPHSARGQSSDIRLIGIAMPLTESDPDGPRQLAPFMQQLSGLGWIEGRNVRFEYRWVGRDSARQQAAARNLVGLAPNVIFVRSTPVAEIVQRATSTVPIVFAGASDPVGSGLVKSLAHPEGNVTGFANFEFSMGGKWLELLKQAAPSLRRVLVLGQPNNDGNRGLWRAIEAAAPSFSLEVSLVDFNATTTLGEKIETFANEPNGGLIILPTPSERARILILTLSQHRRLPAIYPRRDLAVDGGLMSYSQDDLELMRGAATYVDRILRGEKLANLPVQQPTKINLVINLKTARALGLELSPTLLALANEVIE